MHILSLDVGTSSIKAAVVDVATAEPVGRVARVSLTLHQPTPETATLDPDQVWSAVVEAAGVTKGHSVEGLGISCLSPALILLGEKDEPLTPLVTHLDRRSRAEAKAVWNDAGQEFLATTGNKPLPGGITAMSYRHLVKSDPRLRHRIRRYLHANGWLGLRLTGKAAFDRGNACFTGLYAAMTNREWSPRWMQYLDIDPQWLPPVLSGDVTLGPLVNTELGLPAGIPVKLGTADTSCAMLAAGMGEEDLLHVVGTTQVLAVYVPQPQPALHRITRQLGVGDGFIYVSHNPVGGVALDWIHQLCFRDQDSTTFYQHTVPAAMERSPSAVLDPPFLGGDRLEIEPRRAAFRELGLATDRMDLLAALFEAMRSRHYEALEALGHGRSFRRVFLTGGGAEVLQRLIPEYGQLEVVRLEEGSLRGVARLFTVPAP